MDRPEPTGGAGITSLVIVGVGGQGILLATQVAARAALAAGFDVKTNEVHGMAQRGGSVVAQIRFGAKVYSPLVPEGTARALASLERIEALRLARFLAPDGLAVVSRQAIIPVAVSAGTAGYPADVEDRLRAVFANLLYIDAIEAAERLGEPRAANLLIMGALSNALPLPVSLWHEAIAASVKPAFRDVNVKAFEEGRSYRPAPASRPAATTNR
jgi:indolepyruvate ferredoxin oxidoreductase beta subunit